jgi:hypothetical protein
VRALDGSEVRMGKKGKGTKLEQVALAGWGATAVYWKVV